MPGIPKNYTFHDCRLIQMTARKITAPKFYYGNEVTLLIRDDKRAPVTTALSEYELRACHEITDAYPHLQTRFHGLRESLYAAVIW